MIKRIIQGIIAILLFILGKFLLQNDLVPFLQWWWVVLVLGIIFTPITSYIFTSFHDKGYLFSKAIGIAVTGYIMWLLSSLKILKFNEVSCFLVVIFSLIINIIFMILVNKKIIPQNTKEFTDSNPMKVYQGSNLDAIITNELLFFGLFLLFTYVRCFKPEAHGTEKFMDYGFMTSMMRSDFMPPEDFWYSGTKLNYYYVGQFIATYLTKLSFVSVANAYNLMLMMLGAFAFVLPYSLVYNVTSHFLVERNKINKINIASKANKVNKTKKTNQANQFNIRTILSSIDFKNIIYKFLPGLSGVIAGFGVTLTGNMHYPTYKWIEPAVRKFFGMEAGTYRYWFPDATRFIGYHPETTDKTIHEFPAYSFVLGDLHAHVINTLFVFIVLGALFAWFISRDDEKARNNPIWKEVLHPTIILISFLIGLFHTTNFWDYPIYYVVSGAVILFSNMLVYNFKRKAIVVTALQGIFVVLFAELICLPFTLNFDPMSNQVKMAVAHTPLNQLIILWGLPITMVVTFLLSMVADYKRKYKNRTQNLEENDQKAVLFHFMQKINRSDLFIITLGLCAIGLILLPEIIYIKDIYEGDYKRANTMFKLTYQAFIMFGICFGYIFVRLIQFGSTWRQKRVAIIGFLLFLSTIAYTQNAVYSWYGNVLSRDTYQGLDATAFMETVMPDDDLATQWLNENVKGMPVVLEANGDSYTDYQRVSVITGLPTVLGWYTHEWLWKSSNVTLDERINDIARIYTSDNVIEVRSLIDKYNITYIYVGKLELNKFQTVNHGLIKSLGITVFSSPITTDKDYETYIIQVKR